MADTHPNAPSYDGAPGMPHAWQGQGGEGKKREWSKGFPQGVGTTLCERRDTGQGILPLVGSDSGSDSDS
eukprot:6561-Chlamydomonas_euryale.AAC.4